MARRRPLPSMVSSSTSETGTLSLQFMSGTGNSATVYGFIGICSSPTFVVVQFSIDGVVTGELSAPCSNNARSVQFYSTPTLASGTHQLVITNMGSAAFQLDKIDTTASVRTPIVTSTPNPISTSTTTSTGSSSTASTATGALNSSTRTTDPSGSSGGSSSTSGRQTPSSKCTTYLDLLIFLTLPECSDRCDNRRCSHLTSNRPKSYSGGLGFSELERRSFR